MEVFGGLAVIIGLFVAIAFIVVTTQKVKTTAKKMDSSDSLFVTKYKSFKEKICPGVDFNG